MVSDDSDTTIHAPPRRLTIEHVAAEAGVSVATVSRALRGLPNVTPSTRERVRAVADRLNYHPDPAATRLAAGRTGTVTLAIPSLFGWYFSTVIAGAEAVCADAGLEFQVIAVSTPTHRDRLLDESRRLERRTDALILVDVTIEPEQVASLERRGVGLATIGSNVVGHPSVCIDDELVGQIAAEHLLALGHRRIGVIGGRPEGPMSFDVPEARWRGFSRELAAADVAVDHECNVNGNFSLDGGYEAMTQLLRAPSRPTAVFAMSDEMAFGALMACNEHSLRVGTDISLIGVDDHEFSRVVDLTTVRQPVADHGSVVARLLVAALRKSARHAGDPGEPVVGASDEHDEPVRPAVSLVERSSTGSISCT
ncbi:LacI family DNA-binding transcriptional regulator [Ilumatobacter nonamiensis]|uniref:LacI family DNA-binding transcriptional regulator n=1 Tax=Ilumatobacter nonamiensis TaxID=467093 RepID=UPI00130DCAC9|nr:LacI family DNA-binding transcriptional regulator [Ilumatobacter nonamiensis]